MQVKKRNPFDAPIKRNRQLDTCCYGCKMLPGEVYSGSKRMLPAHWLSCVPTTKFHFAVQLAPDRSSVCFRRTKLHAHDTHTHLFLSFILFFIKNSMAEIHCTSGRRPQNVPRQDNTPNNDSESCFYCASNFLSKDFCNICRLRSTFQSLHHFSSCKPHLLSLTEIGFWGYR